MNKINGHVQVLNRWVFFSPNCNHTVEYPRPIQHEEGGESNPFLPNPQWNGCHNYFELDITKYAKPHWWTPAFGWIAFFPPIPSFCGPIFKLFMPLSHHHIYNEELGVYSMPLNLSNKWLWVESDLSDASPLPASLSIPYQCIWLWLFQRPQVVWSTAHGST